MKLLIGENIRRLRREKNLTQEEAAAHLGVSFQAISKWERNEGYPDITLLPALANYFGVTVDDLLGTDAHEARRRYEEINGIWAENNRSGRHGENVSLMREALRSYPNDALLLVQLSTSLEKLDGTEEERRAHLKESLAVQEQILEYGEDSEVRGATMYNICFAYDRLGERDKAVRQAEKLPNLYKARENALVHFLKGEERAAVSRAALGPLRWSVNLHLNVLAEEENSDRWRKKARAILEMLEEE